MLYSDGVNAFAISITTFVGQNYGAGKSPPYAKKRPCLYDNGLHYRLYCKRRYFSVCRAYLPSVYHRSGSCGHRCSYDPFPDPVLCPLCSDRYSSPVHSGEQEKCWIPMILTCGGVCLIRIIWLFVFVTRHPGINNIMLSYPVIRKITAVLFVIY